MDEYLSYANYYSYFSSFHKKQKSDSIFWVKLETIVDQNEFLRADGKERKLFFAFKASLVIFKLRKGSNFMLKKSHT